MKSGSVRRRYTVLVRELWSGVALPVLKTGALALVAVGIAGTLVFVHEPAKELTAVASKPAAPSSEPPLYDWAAVGPGRVEARTGEAKIASQITANVVKLLVSAGDAVEKDEIIAELDNTEQLARLKSARAEVEFRQTERDNAVSSTPQNDRKTAEDAVAAASEDVQTTRADLDGILETARLGQPNTAEVAAKRSAVREADSRLARATAALKTIVLKSGSTKPSRTDSALALARADLAAAQAAWQKTFVRAPFAGRILRTYKVPGELAAASPEDPIVSLADLTSLRVRAELDERDIGKVAIGQPAQVRTDALPEQSFKGRVSYVALAASPKKIASRQNGPQQSENIIEVVVDLEGGAPLIAGMRVDAYFDQTNVARSSGDSYGTN